MNIGNGVGRPGALIGALLLFLAAPGSVRAEQKTFSGSGDGASWHDAANWFTSGVPGAGDSVTLNKKDIAVSIPEDFLAKSITIAGKAVSGVTVDPFVYGTISPSTSSDPAIYIRKDGTLVLSGAGTIVMQGSFKNSEEQLATESSLMILLQ